MYKVYQVKIGDTLDSIAKMFNMSQEEIKKINDIDEVIVGMPIVVLNNKDNNWFDKYYVQPGDTLYQIALANNVDLAVLVALNGLDKDSYIYPNQEIIIPKQNYQVYVTKENDNIIDVLQKMNINFSKLASMNPKIILKEDQMLINKY